MLGEQWSREPTEIKARWKAVAEEIKKKHSEMFPDYQYQPRKPSEKKRRMTRRKAAALAEVVGVQDHNMSAQSGDTAVASTSHDLIVAMASTGPTANTETENATAVANDTAQRTTSDLSVLLGSGNFPEPIPTFETAPNGNLYFDLDNTVSDEAFATMLDEYNESMPAPAPLVPGTIQPNDYPVVGYIPADDSIGDQLFFSSMVDWDALGNDADDYANDALPAPEPEPEPEFDWEDEYTNLANAELERMPAGSTNTDESSSCTRHSLYLRSSSKRQLRSYSTNGVAFDHSGFRGGCFSTIRLRLDAIFQHLPQPQFPEHDTDDFPFLEVFTLRVFWRWQMRGG